MTDSRTTDWRKPAFVVVALLMLTPWISAPIALAAGAAFALTLGNPFAADSGKLASKLLKLAVIGLGFGLPLALVLDQGGTALWVAAIAVVVTLTLGLALLRLFDVERDTGRLITAGTAICGGSAIAALAPAIRARSESLSVALACVFVLNALALYLFPWIGHLLDLSQAQFAVWAALAIHDTSSVVGAAAVYGDEALAQATVFKLARALWIVPLVLLFTVLVRRQDPHAQARAIDWPWFIGLFVLAAVARALIEPLTPLFDGLALGARRLLVLVLFLVGSGLSVELLRRIGHRPLVLAVTLWLIVSGAVLGLVLGRWIPGS
ncbi:MAG: putative sulfate exporter family transporter [Gammaproteobacteria bacterium]|nr:putative sulfate exporter family transporter [Gammaproteobacteria bacterium]